MHMKRAGRDGQKGTWTIEDNIIASKQPRISIEENYIDAGEVIHEAVKILHTLLNITLMAWVPRQVRTVLYATLEESYLRLTVGR